MLYRYVKYERQLWHKAKAYILTKNSNKEVEAWLYKKRRRRLMEVNGPQTGI